MKFLVLLGILQISLYASAQTSEHSGEDEHHHHHLPEESAFIDRIFKRFAHHGDHLHDHEFEDILRHLKIGKTSEHGHEGHHHDEDDHDDESHVDRRLRRSTVNDDNDHHGSGEEHEHEDMKNVTTSCYTSAHLQSIHHVNATTTGINKIDFTRMSPSLLQQVLDKPCEHSDHARKTNTPTTAQIYGFGTLAVFIISLASLGGTFVVGYRNKPVFDYILSFMLALGFAALSGDAFLHLIPTALGLHVHDHGAESGAIVVHDHVWKMLVVMASVYVFYLLEIFMSNYHDHSHGPAINQTDPGHVRYCPDEPNGNDYYKSKTSHCNDTAEKQTNGHVLNGTVNEVTLGNGSLVPSQSATSLASHISVTSTTSTKPLVKNQNTTISSLALMVTTGDAIHNFADGLAIGAAFSVDINSGISTSIAVLCHELPHEFGDFAALLSTGMSYIKAIIITFLTQMTSFVGLYIGIAIGTQTNARQWIFAVTTGMFLYVALAELMPQLVYYYKHLKNKWAVFICQNVGILLGTAILLLIAIFEEHIRV